MTDNVPQLVIIYSGRIAIQSPWGLWRAPTAQIRETDKILMLRGREKRLFTCAVSHSQLEFVFDHLSALPSTSPCPSPSARSPPPPPPFSYPPLFIIVGNLLDVLPPPLISFWVFIFLFFFVGSHSFHFHSAGSSAFPSS